MGGVALDDLPGHLIDHAALKVATKSDIDDVFDSGDTDTSTDDQLNLDSEGQDTDFPAGVTVDVETFITTAFTLSSEDYVVRVDDDTAAGIVTVTLPPVASHTGRVYHIKKLGATADVIVDGNSSETIDGSTLATLTAQYESISIVAESSGWSIF